MIDRGSAVDILYHNTYARMDRDDRKWSNMNLPLFDFTINEVKVMGVIGLSILFGTAPCQIWHVTKFHVVNVTSSYNIIIGRTTLAALNVTLYIPYLIMRFPTDSRVGVVIGDQVLARQY